MDIKDFLLERINEDEMDAVMACRHLVEVGRGDQWLYKPGKIVDPFGDEIRDRVGAVAKVMRGGAHIARHDPARVLAECAAKRAIMGGHERYGGSGEGSCATCTNWLDEHMYDRPPNVTWPCPTIVALAAIYADHPDYQPEWSA